MLRNIQHSVCSRKTILITSVIAMAAPSLGMQRRSRRIGSVRSRPAEVDEFVQTETRARRRGGDSYRPPLPSDLGLDVGPYKRNEPTKEERQLQILQEHEKALRKLVAEGKVPTAEKRGEGDSNPTPGSDDPVPTEFTRERSAYKFWKVFTPTEGRSVTLDDVIKRIQYKNANFVMNFENGILEAANKMTDALADPARSPDSLVRQKAMKRDQAKFAKRLMGMCDDVEQMKKLFRAVVRCELKYHSENRAGKTRDGSRLIHYLKNGSVRISSCLSIKIMSAYWEGKAVDEIMPEYQEVIDEFVKIAGNTELVTECVTDPATKEEKEIEVDWSKGFMGYRGCMTEILSEAQLNKKAMHEFPRWTQPVLKTVKRVQDGKVAEVQVYVPSRKAMQEQIHYWLNSAVLAIVTDLRNLDDPFIRACCTVLGEELIRYWKLPANDPRSVDLKTIIAFMRRYSAFGAHASRLTTINKEWNTEQRYLLSNIASMNEKACDKFTVKCPVTNEEYLVKGIPKAMWRGHHNAMARAMADLLDVPEVDDAPKCSLCTNGFFYGNTRCGCNQYGHKDLPHLKEAIANYTAE